MKVIELALLPPCLKFYKCVISISIILSDEIFIDTENLAIAGISL